MLRIFHTLFILLLLSAFSIATAHARERQAHDGVSGTGEARGLDLYAALRIAGERNMNLGRAANQVELGEIGVERAIGNFLPDLRLSAAPSVRFQSPLPGGNGDTATTLNAGISSSVILFNGYANTAGLREARGDALARRARFGWTFQTTAYLVANGFLELALLREIERVESENLEAHRRQLLRIEALHAAGNRARVDVLHQTAEIAVSEQRLLAVERDVELSRLRLRHHLRLAPDEPVVFAPLPESFTQALGEMELSNSAVLVERALASRDDVAAVERQIEAAGDSIRVARSGYYPSIALNAQADTGYRSVIPGTNFISQVSEENVSATLSVTASMPLFDRSRTRTQVAQAQVNLRNQELSRDAIRQDVSFAIEESALQVRTALAQSAAAEAQAAAANEALSATQARYAVGASTLLEVLQARALQTNAAARLAESTYRVLSSKLALAYESGAISELLPLGKTS
jgi:outer membrane protein